MVSGGSLFRPLIAFLLNILSQNRVIRFFWDVSELAAPGEVKVSSGLATNFIRLSRSFYHWTNDEG